MRALVLFLAVAAVAAGCGPKPPDSTCKGRVAGDLVITEYMKDPDGTDTGKEWVEVFNATGAPIELRGVTIFAGKSEGDPPKTHIIRAGTVPSRGYLTLGDIRDQVNPPHIGYAYGDALGPLTNEDGTIGLKCGETVIDEVKYSKVGKAGHARALDGKFAAPDSSINDVESNWCDAPKEFGTAAFGSPGTQNEICELSTGISCVDGVTGSPRAIVTPMVGDLFISEVMADPKSVVDTEGEWIELHARSDLDLNNLELWSGASKATIKADNCLRLASGEQAVFTKNADPAMNGGVAGSKGLFTFSLTNSGGALQVKAGVVTLDTATYGQAVSGVAAQLDPTKLDATSNDDPMNFCLSTKAFSLTDGGVGDKGTPGAANTTCPIPPNPNECVDSASGMPRLIVRPDAGELVITEFMPNPNKVGDTAGEYLEVAVKAAVDLNGLTVSDEADAGSVIVSSASCIRPQLGEHVIFANNIDPATNGGLPTPVARFGFTMNNTNAGLRLRSGATLVDEVRYASSGDGISTQLSADEIDAVLNDDAGSFCPTPASKTYGGFDGGVDGGSIAGDRGTPGLPNELCP